MKLGDKIYHTKINNQVFRQEKLKMTDADGNTWYRYDRPRWTYACEEHTVVAIVTPVVQFLEGFSPDNVDTDTRLYTDKGEELDECCLDDSRYRKGWFTSRVFAEQYLLDHKHEKAEDND